MNNSKIAFDNLEVESSDRTPFLQKQQGEIAQIIEAINGVEASEDWKKLKRLVLDGVVTSLERQLISEASKDQINDPNMYRLQGQLMWAKKFADLKRLGESFKQSLENIKNQIKHE